MSALDIGLAVPELSVVVPTFNEGENVPLLVARLRRALRGIAWEVIFVDDNSPDGTAERVRRIAAKDAHVRCIRRVGRRGLSGAVVEGMLSSSSPYVAVIDGDLQHDETQLRAMLECLRRGEAELAVGTRYDPAGAAGSGFGAVRASGSRLANVLARRLLKTTLSDPMSGFFMVARTVVEEVAPRLSSQGFKVLLDIVASAPAGLQVREFPYVFRPRRHGASKLDALVVLDYLGLLLAKLTRDLVTVRFLLFALVGSAGVLVHMVALHALVDTRVAFGPAETAATAVSIASNFLLNNGITYRDRSLHGAKLLVGFLVFAALCSLGLVADVGVATLAFRQRANWWTAGLAGAVIGTVWNYVAAAGITWRAR